MFRLTFYGGQATRYLFEVFRFFYPFYPIIRYGFNSFAKNFVSTLRSKGFVVANVNAHDAKKQRGNIQA
ncbi:MAG: hypothetical protein ACQ9MH_25210, partial [Nitrospinales bacterium]